MTGLRLSGNVGFTLVIVVVRPLGPRPIVPRPLPPVGGLGLILVDDRGGP